MDVCGQISESNPLRSKTPAQDQKAGEKWVPASQKGGWLGRYIQAQQEMCLETVP